MPQWYVKFADDIEAGPFSSSHLKKLADQGKIKPDTQIRQSEDDDDDWALAGQFKGLIVSWWDKQFAGTSIVSIVLLSVCLSVAVLPFGIIGLFTCEDPSAQKHALLMVLIPLGLLVLGTLAVVF